MIGWALMAGMLVATVDLSHATVPCQPIAQPEVAMQAMRFEEPLAPTTGSSPVEDALLLPAITRQHAASTLDEFSALEQFLARHPQSGWQLAVLTNLGLSYYH